MASDLESSARLSSTLGQGLLVLVGAILAAEALEVSASAWALEAAIVAAALAWFVVVDRRLGARAEEIGALVKRLEAVKAAVPATVPLPLSQPLPQSLPPAPASQSRSSEDASISSSQTLDSSEPGTRSPSPSPDNHSFTTAVDGWLIKTEAEKSDVEELRRRLADLADDPVCAQRPLNLSDPVLVRFVRARKKLSESEAMFRAARDWRSERDPAAVHAAYEMPPVLVKYLTGGWVTEDKDGTVVWFDRAGLIDTPGLMARTKEQDWLDLSAYRQEEHTRRFLGQERKHGRPHMQLVVVLDLKGLSKRHLHKEGLGILQKMAYVDDHYYPERLKVSIILNAPFIFSAVWNIVKYFFHVNTRNKVLIFSGPAKKELLSRIDADKLPVLWGGTMVVDGDPECSSLTGAGGRIPADEFPPTKDK